MVDSRNTVLSWRHPCSSSFTLDVGWNIFGHIQNSPCCTCSKSVSNLLMCFSKSSEHHSTICRCCGTIQSFRASIIFRYDIDSSISEIACASRAHFNSSRSCRSWWFCVFIGEHNLNVRLKIYTDIIYKTQDFVLVITRICTFINSPQIPRNGRKDG